MGARVKVEIRYFIALSHLDGVSELKRVSLSQEKALTRLYAEFNKRAYQRIKEIESVTKHDVKALLRAIRADRDHARLGATVGFD